MKENGYLALKIFGIASLLLFVGMILIQYSPIQDDLKNKFRNISFLVFAFFALYGSYIFYKLKESISARDKICLYFIFLGLFMFFVAESIWSFYVAILNIDPSLNLTLADLFWLLGSLLLAYGFFKMQMLHTIYFSERMILTITAAALILAFILIFASNEINDIQTMVNSLYPVFDFVIAIQTSLIFYSFRKKNIFTSHYLILAAGFFIMFASDFLYYIISSQLGESLITSNIAVLSDFLYALSYIVIGLAFLTGIESHEFMNKFMDKLISKELE
ncbi:MAG: hypothetical protein QXI89_02105 [Candidatus Anstonellales archaeon]